MSNEAQISEKEKLKQKRQKKKAFRLFLQKDESSAHLDLRSTNLSSRDSKVSEQKQEVTCCLVCQLELGDRKKNCGFCGEPACGQHMRKKRKNKEANKFTRICDNCEDVYLFNKYIKLQLKNQQSMSVQESIVESKMDGIRQQLEGRKTKLSMAQQKQKEMALAQKQQDLKIILMENELKANLDKLDQKLKELDELEAHVNQLQKSLPPPLEQDFHSLQIQNSKVNKDLLKFEKLCNEAMKAKTKREKEVYEEYNKWEQSQRQKLANTNKKEDCSIF